MVSMGGRQIGPCVPQWIRARPPCLFRIISISMVLLCILCACSFIVAEQQPSERRDGIMELEVLDDARAVPTKLSLDELEKAALNEELHANQQLKQTHEQPAVESLLADFDNDGRVGSNEIKQIKENLHHIFDMDDSGAIDTKEIQAMAKDANDVQSAFNKLDRDQDSIISLQELDARWEAVGAEMTVSEVADWVTFSVQLPQYAEKFRHHSISGYTFPLLMQNDGARLQEIGVEHDFHRHQLAKFLRMKYLGMGRKPDPVVATKCEVDGTMKAKTVLYLSWTPADLKTPLRYQLQRIRLGESTWQLVHTGSDTEWMDVVDELEHGVMYRVTVWNSYGRSPHTLIRCDRASAAGTAGATQPTLTHTHRQPVAPAAGANAVLAPSATPSSSSSTSKQDPAAEDDGLVALLKSYLWWLDEAIALTLFIVLPIRGLIYGDANFLMRLFRRLPPNMPTRVTVEGEPNKTTVVDAAVTVSWEKPIDNGVPIVCYCVRWTRLKTEEVKWVKLLKLPLPTSVVVEHLHHGETYKFVVEATNEFGLVTKSSRSTYMVPVPELKAKQLLPQRSIKDVHLIHNQCHLCQDPEKRKKVPFTATLDRRILHFCCRCDREFCHYHKGEVFHTKALSCPAVNGRCLCLTCREKLHAHH